MNPTFFSLLYPKRETEFHDLSEITMHDLGLDFIVKKVTQKEPEQKLILNVLSKMTDDAFVTQYRCDVFMDIYKNPKMRQRLMEILDKIKFLQDFGSFKRDYEESSTVWDLMHRLDEINEYIQCVEAFHDCLSGAEIQSRGLNELKAYVESLYGEQGFEELKKDIKNLKATTSNIKSVTVGINLNERFEAEGIGLISVNSKSFTKSNIIGNFCDAISTKDSIHSEADWDEKYKYHPFGEKGDKLIGTIEHLGRLNTAMAHPVMAGGIASVPEDDAMSEITKYMDRVTEKMLSQVVKKLREVLNKYVCITITDITKLIPEFIYYIRWAEYIEKLTGYGISFCKAEIAEGDAKERIMHAKGIYNLKLASVVMENKETIVTNDLSFDKEHLVYILTGANRGGKTTITQAIGILFVLAQGGIFVPGEAFAFHPVDAILTHFPADEDKTMDLGRLGEECKRFRELYSSCTQNSLLLLNETFSTTSFEEGYFIAKDAVKAILAKGVRTIYNTHMHKLAFDIEEMNETSGDVKAVSLVMRSENGKRSFHLEIAAPEGMSYAQDIAEKYGVTYELLTQDI